MSDHDKIRYELMLETASREVTNYLDLQNLLKDLEILVHSLEGKDNEWLKVFMSKWWILEEYNAIFYDGENASLFNDSVNKINEVRKSLISIINKKN